MSLRQTIPLAKVPGKKKKLGVTLSLKAEDPVQQRPISASLQTSGDPKVLQRQRDELRIRIQHLLHLLHESQDRTTDQAREIQVLKHALSDGKDAGQKTIGELSLLNETADTQKEGDIQRTTKNGWDGIKVNGN